GRQPRVVRVAAADSDRPGEALAGTPGGQAFEIIRDDILGEDVSRRSDPAGQAHRVIAAPGADIGDHKTGLDVEHVHHAFCFAGLVARLLVAPDVGDDARDRPARRGKLAGWHARWHQPFYVA